jgi:hypothetical protein
LTAAIKRLSWLGYSQSPALLKLLTALLKEIGVRISRAL